MPALWPWVNIVRQLLDSLPELGTSAAPSAAAVLAVGTFGSVQGPDQPDDTLLTQTTLYRGVVDLLSAAHRRAPLVIVLDDLQWIDRDSLTLLLLAVDQLASSGVLFAVALRREETSVPGIMRLLETLTRDLLTRIELPPLRPADVAVLVTQMSGQPAEPDLVEAIESRTSGNPMFITELVRLLVAERRLTREAALTALPVGIRDVLQRRIDRLPRSTVTLLAVAALAGSSVLDVDLLSRVAAVSEDEVLDDCEAALLSGLLVERGGAGRFALSHDLVRQTLAGDLSEARRVRLHARIAAALQERSITSPEHVVEVARQLTLAAPAVGAAAAIPYLVSASEDALSRYANASAEATLDSALELAAGIADPTLRQTAQAEIRGLLATVRTWSRAEVTGTVAIDAPSVLHGPADGRAAAGWLGSVISTSAAGHYRWGLRAAQESLEGDIGERGEVAARFALGWLSFVVGDLSRATQEFDVLESMISRGVDIALPGALFHLAESVAGYRALIAHAGGDEPTADELMAESHRRAGHSDRGLLNYELYGCLLAAMRGDRIAAAEHAATGGRIAQRVDYAVFTIQTAVIEAWVRELSGMDAGSMDRALAAHAATGLQVFRPLFLLLRAEVADAAGEPAAAVDFVRRSRHLSQEFGEVCVSPRLKTLAEEIIRRS